MPETVETEENFLWSKAKPTAKEACVSPSSLPIPLPQLCTLAQSGEFTTCG